MQESSKTKVAQHSFASTIKYAYFLTGELVHCTRSFAPNLNCVEVCPFFRLTDY